MQLVPVVPAYTMIQISFAYFSRVAPKFAFVFRQIIRAGYLILAQPYMIVSQTFPRLFFAVFGLRTHKRASEAHADPRSRDCSDVGDVHMQFAFSVV